MKQDKSDLATLRADHADKRIETTMMQVPLSVIDIIDHAETVHPRREVVSRTGPGHIDRTDYGTIAERSRRLAAALQKLGLTRGGRVGTLMWNHAAHLTAYFGIATAGGVLHTLNPRLPAEDIAYIIADAGDSIIIIDDDLIALWRAVDALVPGMTVIVNPLSGKAVEAPFHDLNELLETAPLAGRPDGFDENEAFGICYTSGTTGRPKGVVYSHRSTVLHTLTVSAPDFLNVSSASVIFPVTPMFHVNAWGVPYAAAMLGAKLVLPGPHATPEELLDLMSGEQVTHACGVPTIWLAVLDALEAEPGRWPLHPGLRIDSGGSAPPLAMFRRLAARGIRVHTGWGMTETSPLATQTWLQPWFADEDDETKLKMLATQGIALPFAQIRVADEHNAEMPRDGTSSGELQVRGPWITQSYIGHPAPIPATTSDGWLRTGDISVIGEDGYMRIVDRLKDLVKSGGEWISSIDMENALMAHPDISEAAVIALEHEKWSERPLAVIVAKKSKSPTIETVRAHLGGTYPKWMLPDHAVFVDEIPKTATGKFDKKRLRAQFMDGPPA